MALAWVAADFPEDPDERRFAGDPAELLGLAGLVEELLDRPAWHRLAACRGRGGVAPWFPVLGESVAAARELRELCAGCPVREECLAAGMAETHGFWGGASPRERRRMRRDLWAT